MKSTKDIVLCGVFTAILIGGQLALSGISGIEVVTVLFLSFCYRFKTKYGLLVANAFSLLRCFIFGFYISVILLYLIYYNLFALLFGWLGKKFNSEYTIKKHSIIVVYVVLMTIAFTMIDNVLTPLIYGFNLKAAKAYAIASLTSVIPQTICALVTSIVLFPPILKLLKTIK